MDLDARPFRAFIAVAEERSFSRASERLNLSQPALSALIREFERRLGFALFARTSRHVELTSQGRLFLGNARRMVVEADIAQTAAREIATNALTVGASILTMLVPERVELIERFGRARPDIPLRILNDSNSRLLQALSRREIDLALIIEPLVNGAIAYSPLDAAGAVTPDLERVAIDARPVTLLLPKEHRLSRLKSIGRTDIKGLKIATVDRTNGIALTEAVASYLRECGADFVRPPERNPIAVERYAAVHRCAAISLGWFDPFHFGGTKPMVSRPLAGLDVGSSLSLLRMRGDERTGPAALWQMTRMCGPPS